MSTSKSSASKKQARLRGRPRQAAGAQPLQERPIRQPAGTTPEKLAGIAGRHRRGMANRRNVESRSDKPVKREVRKPWRRGMEPSYMTRS